MTTRKLLFGSGDWHWEGWATLDADASHKPDYCYTVPPLPDVITAQWWDEVLCSHMLEHVNQPDGLTLLREIYGILKDGGKLTLELPDLAYCCAVYLGYAPVPEGKSRYQFGIQGIYGAQDGNPGNQHKFGYDKREITDALLEAGFHINNISIGAGRYHEPARDMLVEAVK